MRNIATFTSHATDHWATPKALYEELNAEFAFDLDPCPLGAPCGPLGDWRGRRVWCNPPYGPKVRDFLAKGPEAVIAVFLLPVRTDTKWFHELVLFQAYELRFIQRRVRFGSATTGAPFPSMLAIFKQAAAGNQL